MADTTRRPGRPAHGTKSGSPLARRWRALALWQKIIAGLVAVVLAVVLVGGVAFAGMYATTSVPDPNADFQTNTTNIYYGDGTTQLADLAIQNRTTLPPDQMPQGMKDAVVAAEDRTFYTNPGISPMGMTRALFAILGGGDVQGGSTITQQYIKLMYLTPQRTLKRKINEVVLALKLSNQQSKDQILTNYLNTVYFGRGSYGVQAAAQTWYGKDAKDLTVPESAILASVVQNPSIMDPSVDESNMGRLQARYEYVLSGMLQEKSITQAQYDQYKGKMPALPKIPINPRYEGPKGFLVNMAEQELTSLGFTDAQINGGGLRVTTTFDAAAQAAAVKASQTYQKQAEASAKSRGAAGGNVHAAIASVDTASGELIAVYGGDNFVKNSRNWATTSRMTGSTFKAFGVIAGLRDGFSLNSIFRGNTFTPAGETETIRNEFSMQYGPVTLLKATAESINTAFVDMVSQMENGPKKVMQAANDAGAPTAGGWDPYNRVVLGIAEVSPVDMANSYATLANGGKRNKVHVIREVKDSDGNVLYQAPAKGEQTIDQPVAADTTYALESVVNQGTGARASALGRPVAGKTGTAGVGTTIASAWFVAYTKQVSTAVMYVAGDDGHSDLDPYRQPGTPTFFGAGYPAMTWLDYMQVATKGQPVLKFDQPANLKSKRVGTSVPQAPTTQGPAIQATQAPTQAPATQAPTTQAPTQAPTTQAPTTQAPTQAPATDQPTQAPATTQPTQAPATTQPTQAATTGPNRVTGNSGKTATKTPVPVAGG
ncbi:Membrane carboxypeptidase (penicillin-binding protein) [Raineyella antarctica]|uniref:Membrane carboxypeptidase (Penicillin-binding protein) n=1 Tax=Raineyella antarctica TaxID=1577474 RepID=A0A1G6HSX0_9ACTN|nr:transglycosylase domain-containing protein [Raineyella antarctica]SDB96586.1 Membrane carboxypeptidase (penicillin-binding protein) [Raineyella antarctica]